MRCCLAEHEPLSACIAARVAIRCLLGNCDMLSCNVCASASLALLTQLGRRMRKLTCAGTAWIEAA
jgi:hypothetical protein